MKPQSETLSPLQSALQHLPGGPLAGKRHEDWRYTDLRPAIDIGARWLADGARQRSDAALAASIASITASINANWLVIANGIIDDDNIPNAMGIEIERIDVAQMQTSNRPLAALGATSTQDGLRISVHAATDAPLGLLIVDAANQGASVAQTRIELSLSANCSADIIEVQLSTGDGDHFGNFDLTLQLEDAAVANYVRLQNRASGHVQTGHLAIEMGRDSALAMASYDLGGGLIRNDVVVDIAAPGATAKLLGLYLVGEGQHVDNHTRIDHRVGPATSSQQYRGILSGKCRAVWNGKAIVHEGADGSDANQENHNLLLSDRAEIDTKPELEIYAEDVKCSHGTTVGQLDEAALYYLRTRGIDTAQATQILTHAFAADLVHRIPVDACRQMVSDLVESRLSAMIADDVS